MAPLMRPQPEQDYGSKPCYGELLAIVVVGTLHVAAEFALSSTAARAFNICAAIAFLLYVIWRATRNGQILRIWGMQCGTFWRALKLQLLFGLPAMAILVLWGIYTNHFPPPPTFLLTVVLYPVWGITQQFALQNLLARNLRTLVRPLVLRALIAAGLFALAHVPLMSIVVLTFVAGFFITWIYAHLPNLWAAGCVHGLLGAMAFYFVLGKDPGSRLLQFFFG